MPKFDVTLGYRVSQAFHDIEAEDYEAAIEAAFAKGMDHPNISNQFEQDGDEYCIAVYDEEGNEVYGGDEWAK